MVLQRRTLAALLLSVTLLAGVAPGYASKGHHRRHKFRDEHIHYPLPPLPVMKARFAWAMQKNKEERYPRHKYGKIKQR